jgi:hypothetical protein
MPFWVEYLVESKAAMQHALRKRAIEGREKDN